MGIEKAVHHFGSGENQHVGASKPAPTFRTDYLPGVRVKRVFP